MTAAADWWWTVARTLASIILIAAAWLTVAAVIFYGTTHTDPTIDLGDAPDPTPLFDQQLTEYDWVLWGLEVGDPL